MAMTVNEFLQMYNRVDEEGFNATRPRVKCADGYSISVQAGKYLYSTPRGESEWFSEVELGFPSENDTIILEYAEEPEKPTQTVYPYVPVSVVDKLMERHGGIVGADLSNQSDARIRFWGGDSNA